MPSVAESLNQSPWTGPLRAGVDLISLDQVITFTQYKRVVLPLDGYVFWVNSALVGNSAIPNVPPLNSATPNQPSRPGTPVVVKAKGSLHFEIERHQDEDRTTDINRVTFTSEAPVDEFDQINPMVMFLGTFPAGNGPPLRFSFSRRQNFYQQAGLWHYIGDAVYPDMETQIVDTLNGFDARSLIVSNSLPIWLAMNQMAPPYPFPARQQIPMFPSFLVPEDMEPPYASVHVYPDDTQAITAAPYLDQTFTHTQFARDRVKITFYGLRNFNALDFVDYVNALSLQWDADFGIMNIPTIRDEKRTQREMTVIAQKKSIIYEIDYYQERVRNVARQLIKTVMTSYLVGGALPTPPPGGNAIIGPDGNKVIGPDGNVVFGP